jgi:alkyl sulfatase BDS1-like metallo-beta-lactamase superfamily hydrolase
MADDLALLPFDDRSDFDDARRGQLAPPSDGVVRGTDGRMVWDLDAYAFLLDEDCPATANPSLWRQAQLNAIAGLFEVVPGVYQVRGVDLSNMTLVEGEGGVLVIDPLISVETAEAALALYRQHRGERPVAGVLYTHSHVDHFGGVRGVIGDGDDVPVIAPAGFLDHAVSENVYAGPAMTRRAAYMYGNLLDPGPTGQLGTGLGLATSTGRVSLVAPTVDITETGQELTVDGIRMEFQLTPGTEAPAEMNFLLVDHRALCAAENATHNLHNVVTLRGALVRDARAWSRYLDEAVDRFGDRLDVVFAQHHWPRWGRERALDLLEKQRDLYGYLHDQTLRLLNQGYTAPEIAERIELPPSLAREWHCRGYYGSVSHNVKAVYQRYLGWFDGNPAHLWPHPPEEAARRYVDFMGGADEVLRKAEASLADGDLRWVAEVTSHVVFADPANTTARELLARAFDQLGYGSENATWRNFFLSGALELRGGVVRSADRAASADLLGALSVEHVFDSLAVRVDGPKAADLSLTVAWHFTEPEGRYLMRLSNGVLSHRPGREGDEADATIRLARSALDDLLTNRVALDELLTSGRLVLEGDVAALGSLFGVLDRPDPGFAIVTP